LRRPLQGIDDDYRERSASRPSFVADANVIA
jgi:hypothetical protein